MINQYQQAFMMGCQGIPRKDGIGLAAPRGHLIIFGWVFGQEWMFG